MTYWIAKNQHQN